MDKNCKLFLLDAYALIYRAYFAFSKNPRINSKGFNTSAVMGFVNTLEDILKKEDPTHIGVVFDPPGGSFRHEIYKEYKAQREETPETIRQSVPIIKDILAAYRIPAIEVKGYEADDVIGTLSLQAGRENILTYMMTPDKDYGQLVGGTVYMYRPKYGDKEYEIMGTEEIKAKFGITDTAQVIDMLGLMGDSSDNIPGCPGVGEKTAQKLIAEYGSIENLLDNTDKLKGALKKKIEENKEQIKFSKFLATIKTDVPISLDMKSLERESPDLEKLRTIFEEMEFRTLIDRIIRKAPDNNAAKAAPQDNLLALFADEDTKEQIHENLARLEDLDYSYKLIETEKDMDDFLAYFMTRKVFSLDTETTGTDPITAKLVGMSFSCKENEAFYIPVPQDDSKAKETVKKIKPLVENPASLKVGQNMKYDIIMLARYGAEVRGEMFDTMVAHYVIQPELRHNMDYLAEIYLNYRTIHIEELIGEKKKGQKKMSDLTPQEIYKYACEDADVTLKLKNILEKELQEKNDEKLFREIEMPLVPVLAQMEMNGARIDTAALKNISEELSAKMQAIETEIYALAGTEFNISSPRQVGDILFNRLQLIEKAKKTKSGQYSTSEEVLESMRHKHPIVEKILDYRGLKKLLTTYVDALPQLINPETGKIHTSFNQTVTATGRLSSSNPNLQNIPVRDENGREIRRAFIPDDGCLFFSADYSQIELRIMAHMSGDKGMVEAFRSGEDIHTDTAAKVYKVPAAEVTKAMRSKAKTANFGIIYGISAFGLAERMGVDRREAKELIDEYFKTYPGIKAYIEKSVDDAKRNGYAETLFHRKRFLPDINSHNAVVRGYAERNAVNAPIQGTAADIIKVAMINIHNRLKREGLKAQMIIQVHDELDFNVPENEKEQLQAIVMEEMQNACHMSVPLTADCGWGANWLEAH
ncbi:MAG TPA: DNA polymerase I [Candidatus Avibacteroides excrementipullorum]|jgi:DNA polymerase-1|nr:DNA polymerase I [Candidatus Avibacteroides excrementipullorum]